MKKLKKLHGITILTTLFLAINFTAFSVGPGTNVPPPEGMPECVENDPPGNTTCIATPICNLNGYCGTTSSSYSADYWSALNTAFCGTIENNAFLSFTTNASDISFDAYVYNCGTGEAIQIMIFEAENCSSGPVTNFICVNEMYAQDTPYNVSASGLIPGKEYYIMIDGYAGDVCDYTFVATSGVSTPVTADVEDIQIDENQNYTVCIGESLTVTATGGLGNYEWQGEGLSSNTGDQVVINPPNEIGIYEYTITSTGQIAGCPGENDYEFTVNVIQGDAPVFTQIPPICEGEPLTLPSTSNNGLDGSWSPPPNNMETTVYEFTPDDASSLQCNGTVAMEIEVISNPSVDTLIYENEVCENGSSVQLSGIPSGSFSGNGVVNNTFNPNEVGPGTHEISYHFTDENGCENDTIAEIIVNPIAEFDIEYELPTCGNEDGVIKISGLNSGDDYTFTFTQDGNEIGPSTVEAPNNGEIIMDTLPVGEYSNFEITTENGCINIDNEIITLVFSDAPSVSAPNNMDICIGGEVTLTATDYDNADIEWDNGVTDGESFSLDEPGTYVYTVTASVDNCSASDEVTVIVHPNPTPQFEADQTYGCPPFVVTFTNTTDSQNGEFTWDFGDGKTSNETNNVSHTYGQTGTYDVTLSVTNEYGCSNDTTYVDYIEVIDNPQANFSANPDQTTLNETTVDFTNNSNNAESYIWNFADGSSPSTDENVSHTFPNDEPGTYTVTLTATNDAGCTDVATQEIVIVYPDPKYEIPNIFTPNGDGDNDVFKLIHYDNVQTFDVVVLNRWGNPVFESDKVNFEWNGKKWNDGVECVDGVYFYKMNFYTYSGDQIQEYGYVHLVRNK